MRVCTLEAVASIENLHLAAANARRGKSRREEVETWWLRRESHLRRTYAVWPLEARLKRRRRKHRVLRGGSWNNDNPDNFTAFNRNNNQPDNRNDNNGFRCGVSLGVSPKAGTAVEQFGVMSGGSPLPDRSQEASLTAAPAPAPNAGKDAARAVAGNPNNRRDESHGPQAPRQLEFDLDD